MSLKDQLINFFTTKYYNNLKYSNRTLAALRIFFERTTKYTTSMSTLGNVYRNSKWSDFKVQNIKFKFQKQSANMFLLLVLFLLTILFLLKMNYIDISSFWVLPSYFLYTIHDLLVYGYLSFLMLVYSIITKFEILTLSIIRKFFSFGHNLDMSDNTEISEKCVESSESSLKPTFNAGYNNINTEWVLLAHRLYKVVHSINLIGVQVPDLQLSQARKNSLVWHLHLVDNYRKFVAIVLFLDLKKRFNLETFNTNSIGEIEKLYYIQANTSFFYKNTTILVNPEFFNNLNFLHKKTLMSILEQNLNLNKQNKWLWKNNILSDKLVLQSTSWTTLKKLYGNPLLDKNTSNLNIWYSNKLANATNFKKLNNLLNTSTTNTTALHNAVGTSNFFLNLNTYESSLFWTTKRYKFLQNLGNNVHYRNLDVVNKANQSYNTFFFFNNYNLFLNSVVFNYNFSQIGLSVLNINGSKLSNDVLPIQPSVIYNMNKDILSSMDSEFITYTSKDIMLKNNYLNFFTNVI